MSSIKKLQFSKETLRSLDEQESGRIAGGEPKSLTGCTPCYTEACPVTVAPFCRTKNITQPLTECTKA
jgi:hypothetical protein